MGNKIFHTQNILLCAIVWLLITVLFVLSASVATVLSDIVSANSSQEAMLFAELAIKGWYINTSPLLFALLAIAALAVAYTAVVMRYVIEKRQEVRAPGCTTMTIKSISVTVVGFLLTLGGNFIYSFIDPFVPVVLIPFVPFGGITMIILGVAILLMNAYSAYLQTKHPFVCYVPVRDGTFFKPFK